MIQWGNTILYEWWHVRGNLPNTVENYKKNKKNNSVTLLFEYKTLTRSFHFSEPLAYTGY